MKLKQKLTIDGVEYVHYNKGCAFAHLATAQQYLANQRPDLGMFWLQAHPRITEFLNILSYTGKVEIFSLMDQLHLKLEWSWVQEIPAIEVMAVQDNTTEG